MKLTPKGKPSLMRWLPPDDPIYRRGFVVGQKWTPDVRRDLKQEHKLNQK